MELRSDLAYALHNLLSVEFYYPVKTRAASSLKGAVGIILVYGKAVIIRRSGYGRHKHETPCVVPII